MPYAIRVARLEELVDDSQVMPVSISITECRDPKDNKFLELAVQATATLIVSGDKDLLDLNPFNGVAIITARAFVERE